MHIPHFAPASIAMAVFGCLSLPALAAPHINIPPKVCDVTQYGANGQRQQVQLNTDAIQSAIDDCAKAGGGTVRVPAGSYLTAPLALRSNIRLQLDKNATLVASSEEASWRPTDATKEAAGDFSWLPFISAANISNVAISGEGTIDGQGAVWWERWRADVREDAAKRGSTNRPRLIYVRNSQNVLIEGVTITNSPSFHVVLRDSEDVDITHNRIIAPWHAPNSDAIDPMNSRNVRITYNYIDCNDDHVAIKAEKPDPKYPEGVVRNIYIAHNTLMQGRGISIGSETAGGVDGVLVEHNTFNGSMYGLRIKSPRGKGGVVRNVVYRDTTMVNVGVPLVFSGYYQGAPAKQEDLEKKLAEGGFLVGDQIYPPETDPVQPFDAVKTPHFSGITIENLVSTGNSKAAGYIIGVPEAPLSDFRFRNVRIEADTGLLVRNAKVHAEKLKLNIRKGKAIEEQQNGKISS
jgi:polygalacturonase